MRAVRAVDGGVRGMIALMQCAWLALVMVRGAALATMLSLRCARLQARADAACAVHAGNGGVRGIIALMQYVWFALVIVRAGWLWLRCQACVACSHRQELMRCVQSVRLTAECAV